MPISHLVQPINLGAVLAFLTANILNAAVKAVTTTVNGWSINLKCGQPGNGILLRAGCAKILPGINVAQEAAYWTTVVDGAGRRLNGQHEYVMNFPVGQLPPNDAFWSLAMTDVVGFMVSNPIDRYSVGDPIAGGVARPCLGAVGPPDLAGPGRRRGGAGAHGLPEPRAFRHFI